MAHRVLNAVAVAAAVLIAASCGFEDTSSPTGPSQPTTSTSTSTSPPPASQTGCTPPPAPTNLRVTSIVRTSVELTWNAVAGATSYTLMVGSAPGGTDQLFSDTTQTSFRFTARDGKSFARVQAHSACGAGPSTGSIEFFIPG